VAGSVSGDSSRASSSGDSSPASSSGDSMWASSSGFSCKHSKAGDSDVDTVGPSQEPLRSALRSSTRSFVRGTVRFAGLADEGFPPAAEQEVAVASDGTGDAHARLVAVRVPKPLSFDATAGIDSAPSPVCLFSAERESSCKPAQCVPTAANTASSSATARPKELGFCLAAYDLPLPPVRRRARRTGANTCPEHAMSPLATAWLSRQRLAAALAEAELHTARMVQRLQKEKEEEIGEMPPQLCSRAQQAEPDQAGIKACVSPVVDKMRGEGAGKMPLRQAVLACSAAQRMQLAELLAARPLF
jgi:hypothetical protein